MHGATGDPGPVDPDVEARDRGLLEWDVLLAVAVGGVVGAEARYGLGRLIPHTGRGFPWATLLINVTGCLLIGVLLAVLAGSPDPPRLARPLLGTGVLGGYTTFSTFAVDVDTLAHAGQWAVAAAYLLATVALCLAAVALAGTVVRAVVRRTGGRA